MFHSIACCISYFLFAFMIQTSQTRASVLELQMAQPCCSAQPAQISEQAQSKHQWCTTATIARTVWDLTRFAQSYRAVSCGAQYTTWLHVSDTGLMTSSSTTHTRHRQLGSHIIAEARQKAWHGLLARWSEQQACWLDRTRSRAGGSRRTRTQQAVHNLTSRKLSPTNRQAGSAYTTARRRSCTLCVLCADVARRYLVCGGILKHSQLSRS